MSHSRRASPSSSSSSSSSASPSASSPPSLPPFLTLHYPWLAPPRECSATSASALSTQWTHRDLPSPMSPPPSSQLRLRRRFSAEDDVHTAQSPSSAHLSPSASPFPAPSPRSFPSLSPSLPSSVPYFAHLDELPHDPSLSYEKAMIAGAAAGVMEHLAMFPVDTIKTNMQVAPSSSSQSPANLLQVTRALVQERGVLRLYRGVTAVVIGAIPSHAVNYAAYEFFKRKFGGDQPGHHVLANAVAGSLATCAHDAVITPLDVVKQRLQVVNSRYSGVLHCVKAILREEGIGAFYASYPTTVLMNVPFMAVHFAGYESFKLLLTGADRQDEHGVAEELIAGGLAGACAGLVSTPLDVVKTRIQTQMGGDRVRAKRALVVVKELWRAEGMRGFTRGASARVLYFMPSAAICWTTYETMKRLLKDAW